MAKRHHQDLGRWGPPNKNSPSLSLSLPPPSLTAALHIVADDVILSEERENETRDRPVLTFPVPHLDFFLLKKKATISLSFSQLKDWAWLTRASINIRSTFFCTIITIRNRIVSAYTRDHRRCCNAQQPEPFLYADDERRGVGSVYTQIQRISPLHFFNSLPPDSPISVPAVGFVFNALNESHFVLCCCF